MSRFCRTTDSGRAGFMLLEVLVALAVAAMVLGVLSRILSTGWERSRVPMEQVSALNIALAVAAGSATSVNPVAPDGQVGRFAYSTSLSPLTIEQRPSRLAPPIERLDGAEKPQPGGSNGILQRISVVVRAPATRSLALESVRLETPAR